MRRRTFLSAVAGASAHRLTGAQAAGGVAPPMGINTYSVRAMRWSDRKLLDYAAKLRMDAVFLQDSPDPRAQDPAHWDEVRQWSRELGLHLETGGGGIFPKTADAFDASAETLRKQVQRAKAMGSPIVRAVIASDRASLPPGPIPQHIETVVRLLKAVKPQVADAGLKIAIEVHKDLQAWELRNLIEEAGRDFVGVYMDTGNPVFVLEHPMTTLETLAPSIVTFHLRDSVIYEHPQGVAVQWVPLGEGVVDFPEIIAKARQLCPNVHYYIKPITGRPPQVLPYLEDSYWKLYPQARAADLARFLTLAKKGLPYERNMVIEDLPGRKTPEPFVAALQFQQREHLERSVEYARTKLGLGRRIRS